jgi:hypothetical protein
MPKNKNAIALLVFLSLALASPTLGQATIQGTGKFNEAIQWMEEYLAFSYKSKSTNKWWNNRLFYEAKTNSINIKNSSSKIPNGVDKLVYYDRRAFLKELDLTSVRIEKTGQGDGRIPPGKVVKVDVIGNEKRVTKLFNGRSSFKESTLQFAFPESDSSLYQLAEKCKKYLSWAIEYSSRIYPYGDAQQNLKQLYSILPGTYRGTNHSTCEVIKLFPYTLEFQFLKQGQLYKKGLVNYDVTNNRFVYWTVEETKSSQCSLELRAIENIELTNKAEKFSIALISQNQFNVNVDENFVEYYRAKLN